MSFNQKALFWIGAAAVAFAGLKYGAGAVLAVAAVTAFAALATPR